MSEVLHRAEALFTNGAPDEALALVSDYLNENADDWRAHYMAGGILKASERLGLAISCYEAALRRCPQESRGDCLNGIAGCHTDRGEYERALGILAQAKSNNPHVRTNIGLCLLHLSRPEEAIQILKGVLAEYPDFRNARDNLSLAQLAIGEWREGWVNYNASLGTKFRRIRNYEGEPVWSGQPVKRLVVYGEQGIGDEIMFASCIPDAMERAEAVAIECEPRLEGLFRRSFPDARVFGTRFMPLDEVNFDGPEASCAIGALPQFFRNSDADFPGKPYLIADPMRRAAMRGMLDYMAPNRPKIGIAWSGGSKQTGSEHRSLEPHQMQMLFNALPLNAKLISLEYKPCDTPEWVTSLPHITQSKDYDDTAALVAELDAVVCVTTAVVHLAGALGVPTWCMTSDRPSWRYASGRLPWYSSVTLMPKLNTIAVGQAVSDYLRQK